MIKKVYFVRHGETEGNLKKFFQYFDTPLTESGHKGASALADRFKHLKIDELIVSPYLRTQQTAKPISEVLGLPIVTCSDFHEVNQAAAMRGKDMFSEEGLVYSKLFKDTFTLADAKLEGAENYFDVMTRVQSGVEMLEQNKNENILVVSHGNFLRFVIAYLLLEKTDEKESVMKVKRSLERMSNVAITECTFEEGRWRMFTWNDHAHFAE